MSVKQTEKTNVWVVNHYAVPPSKGTFVRQYYFARHLEEEYTFNIFTASKIHNTTENLVSAQDRIVTQEFDEIPFHFIRTRDYSGNGLDRIINLLQYAIKVPFLSSKKAGRPNLIYASSPDILATFMSVFLAWRFRAGLMVEVRDIMPWSISEYSTRFGTNHPIIRVLSAIEKWIYRRADAVVFTMAGGQDYIRDRGWDKKIPLDKIYYVNNGIDLDQFKNVTDKQKKPKSLKLVYAGSIRQANGILTLVQAMKNVPDGVRLDIYGDGGEVEQIRMLIQDEHLENVALKGRVAKKEIPGILPLYDAAVLFYQLKENSILNKYGSSQNKLFEYLAAGLPVLSNQEFGYDIINSHGCGISRNCRTPEEFGEVIREFAQIEPESYQKMARRSRETAEQFDWKNLSKTVQKIFKTIIE